MKYIIVISSLLFSSYLQADSLNNQCEALIQRLENLSCNESLDSLGNFMEANALILETYELNVETKREHLSLLHETLNASARTVQDCLIKYSDKPNYKPLINAQVSITSVVLGLENWLNYNKYLIPPKDLLLEDYEKTIEVLYEFTNNNGV